MNREPFVITKAKTHSYMGNEVEKLIKAFLGKLGNPEKEQALILEERLDEQKAIVMQKDADLLSYEKTTDQMEAELENLLTLNDMYQGTIRNLEKALDHKDNVIADQLAVITKLTEDGGAALQDLKLVFFKKQEDLVDQIRD